LQLISGDGVAFSPAFSDEVEAYFAGQMQGVRVVAQGMRAQGA
jgi:hypothetical protein